MPDGSRHPVSSATTEAFAALGRGEASAGQQKRCLSFALHLCGLTGFSLTTDSDRTAAYTEGRRWVGATIAKLVGGEQPLSLRHLGDMNDGHDST